MTDTEEMVILPGSGEVVALNAEPAEIAAAWEELQTLERDLRSVKQTRSPGGWTSRAGGRWPSTA
jgi:hypothetical protein